MFPIRAGKGEGRGSEGEGEKAEGRQDGRLSKGVEQGIAQLGDTVSWDVLQIE